MRAGIIAAVDIINNQPIGGLLGFINNISRYINADVFIIGYTSRKENVGKLESIDGIMVLNLFYYDIYKSHFPLRLISLIKYIQHLPRILRLNLDRYYIHGEECVLPFLFISKATRRFILHTHGANLPTRGSRFSFARNFVFDILWKTLQKIAYFKVDKIIVIDEISLKLFNKSSYLKKVVLIPNSVDRRIFFYNEGLRVRARSELGLSPETITLLFVGRIEKFKNIELFIKFISILKLSYKSPLKAIIIGEGTQKSALDKIVRTNKLVDDIMWLGTKESIELVDFYNAADLFLLPSKMEGFPMVLLEGIACGLPAIAFNVGGINKIIINEENGYITEIDQNHEENFCLSGLKAINSTILSDRIKISHTVEKYYSENISRTLNNALFL